MPRWCLALVGLCLLSWLVAGYASAAVAKIAAGGDQTYMIKMDGTLWALGDNTWGALGSGVGPGSSTPIQIRGGTNVSAVAAVSNLTLFVKSDRTLWAMGNNVWGQLGNAVGQAPVQISGVPDAIAVAATDMSSVFLRSDNTLWTLGGRREPSTAPGQVIGASNVISVVANSSNVLFITADGTLWTLGSTSYAYFNSINSETVYNSPMQVSGGTDVTAVTVGGNHTVFIKTDGTLWAVGDNSLGQLGDGTTTSRSTPVQVNGGTNVAAVTAGLGHTVFLKTDGTLWAMGANSSGQLGDGTTTSRNTPVLVVGGANVTAVAAGDRHTVFLKTDGTLWGTGSNYYGQLSNSNQASNITTPALINQSISLTPIGAKSVVAGYPIGFTISGVDGDSGTLTYGAASLPTGATFTPATQTFSWTPALSDVGSYNVTFSVANGVSKIFHSACCFLRGEFYSSFGLNSLR